MPVPLYARAGMGVDSTASMPIPKIEELSLFPVGEFKLNPYGKLTFGVGAADVVFFEGYGRAGFDWIMEFPEHRTKNLSIDVSAGVKVVVLVFTYEKELWTTSWSLYGNKKTFGIKAFPVSSEKFKLFSDHISKEAVCKILFRTKLHLMGISPERVKEKLLQENIFPYSEFEVVSRDGKTYLFWIYDNPERKSADRTELVYSIKKEEGWTEPQPVFDNGTADFDPKAVILPDGKVLVVWEDADTTFGDNAELKDMAKHIDISSAIYDPASGKWIYLGTLEKDSAFDHSAKLSEAEGKVMLVWLKNAKGEIIGTKEAKDDLMFSIFDGKSWSSPKKICTEDGILKTAVSYNGKEGYVVFEKDVDGDLSTIDDRELYYARYDGKTWSSVEALTQDNTNDMNPKLEFVDNHFILIWLKGDNILMAQDFDLNNTTVVCSDMKSPAGMSFDIIKRIPSGLSLVYSGSSEKGADIYLTHWDEVNKKWGIPRQITNDDSLERSISGTYEKENSLILAYNKVKITTDESGNPVPSSTDLYLLDYEEAGDLYAKDIWFSDEMPSPKEKIKLYGLIENTGDRIVQNIKVGFYSGEPSKDTLIGYATYKESLAPGETGTVELEWKIPDVNKPITVFMEVDPDKEKDDIYRENNICSVKILKPNLALLQTRRIKLAYGKYLAYIKLTNNGATDAGEFDVVVKRGKIEEKRWHIKGLKVGEIWEKQFIVQNYGYYVYVDAENTVDEYNEKDNQAYIGENRAPEVENFVYKSLHQNPPFEATFTCSAKDPDPDGSIAFYNWDFDGDGNTDAVTKENTVTHIYDKAGVYHVKVTVVDNNGGTISFSKDVAIGIKKADINADGKVDLKDAIIALKITAGLSVNQKIYPETEPTGDGRIGLDDAIFILRKLVQ